MGPSAFSSDGHRATNAVAKGVAACLTVALCMLAISASFGQTSMYIATDCPCAYYFYLEGNYSIFGSLGGNEPYEWQGSISTDPAGATMAIKKPGYGVVLGPDPLPPVDGTVLNEDCHPVPDCDCVLDGHSYTPNLQVRYDAASHGFVGKLTCNYHP